MKISVGLIIAILLLSILFFGLINIIGKTMKSKSQKNIETAEPIPTHYDGISTHLGAQQSADKAVEIEKKRKKLIEEREDRMRSSQF